MQPVLRWRSFLYPKRGHSAAECEDAIAGDLTTARFAIADGASESFASGEWARLLVEGFVAAGTNRDWLAAPEARWRQEVGERASSWYAEEKFAAGAHATFLGIQFTLTDDEVQWGAEAVGDACLIVMRAEQLESSFPLTSTHEFTRAPGLLNSRGGKPVWEFGMGTLTQGSTLLLATDALAECLLQSAQQGLFAGGELLALTAETFGGWVEATRAAGQIRNDDVALGIIELA